ncbi:MAG: hypothetical protein NVSMB26_23500 [Beijerinckiaceae bacterium]
MLRVLAAAALLASLAYSPALAQTKVGDWQIQKRPKDDHCNATRAYKDADDDDRLNIILFMVTPETIVIVLNYEGWEWEKKGEKVKAKLATDKKTLVKSVTWVAADKETLSGTFAFDQSIIDALGKAKTLKLEFDDDDDDSAEFDIPRAGEALAALKFCEENKQ